MTIDAGRRTARRRPVAAWTAAGLTATGLTLATAGVSQADPSGTGPGAGPGAAPDVPMVSMSLEGAQASSNDGYLVGRLRPGASQTWQMEITNTGKLTAPVSLYPAAASVSGGSFTFAPGRGTSQLTSWVRLSQSALTLKPGQHATETAIITVPASASLGEQYGVVWAQTSTAKQTNRVGIRIYLSVGSGAAPAAAFTIGSPGAMRQAGNQVLSFPVRNTGGVAVNLGGSLVLANGPGGQHDGPYTAPLSTTLGPGQSGSVAFTLNSALPAGAWQAQVTLRGGTAVQKGTFPVSLSAPASAQAAPASGSASGSPGWLAAGLAAGGVVIVAAIGAMLLLVRRSRRRGGAAA